MCAQKSLRSEHRVSSTDLATDYARRMVLREASGPGDVENAMRRIEAKTGVGYWTLWGLWNRRRKLVDRDLFLQLRNGYLAICERQLKALQLDLATETEVSGDDSFEDLAREAEALASRIRAARERA